MQMCVCGRAYGVDPLNALRKAKDRRRKCVNGEGEIASESGDAQGPGATPN